MVWQRQTACRQPFKFISRFADIFDPALDPEKTEVSAAKNRDPQLQSSNRVLPKENQAIFFALRASQLELRCPAGAAAMAFETRVSEKTPPILRDNRDRSVFHQLGSRERFSSKTGGDAR